MLPHLYLIRHGETEWSLSGRHTGRTDLPLTARGEDQARDLGRLLRQLSFAQVLSSPRLRAQQTCALAGLGPAVETEPDLAEWDYGDYEGQRSEEIQSGRPGWNIFDNGCPHGENPGQIAARADRLLARLRRMTGNIALFTHGHFGRILGVRWIGLPVSAGQHFLFGTTAFSVLSYEHDNAAAPAIMLWNASATEFLARRDGQTAAASSHDRP